jgi:hypothetical protein
VIEVRLVVAFVAALASVVLLGVLADPVRVLADTWLPWVLGLAGVAWVGGYWLAESARQRREVRERVRRAEQAAGDRELAR